MVVQQQDVKTDGADDELEQEGMCQPESETLMYITDARVFAKGRKIESHSPRRRESGPPRLHETRSETEAELEHAA